MERITTLMVRSRMERERGRSLPRILHTSLVKNRTTPWVPSDLEGKGIGRFTLSLLEWDGDAFFMANNSFT
jgi:hypothetical protein